MAQQLGGPGPSHKPEAAAAQRQAVPAPPASPGFSAGRAGWASLFFCGLTDCRPGLLISPEKLASASSHACPVGTGQQGSTRVKHLEWGPARRELCVSAGFSGDHKDDQL